jgi:hypothetical protein
MFKVILRLVLGLLGVVAAVGAFADTFDQEIASIILLQLKPVQKELGVTAQQRDAMNKFADAHRAKLTVYYNQLKKEQSAGQKPSMSQDKLVGLFNELKQGVLSELSEAQIKRLREISLQALDFTALADKAVADRIGLTGAQQKKVRTVISSGVALANKTRNTAINQATASLMKSAPKTDTEKKALYAEADRKAEAASQKVNPQLLQIRTQTRAEVMSMLTPSQKAKWQALLGRPYHLPG